MSIAYDQDFLARLTDGVGDFAGASVLAHEWGHHVSAQLDGRTDADSFPVQRELTADCLAGMYTAGYEVATGDETTYEDFGRALFELGNDDYSADAWFGSGEHGSAKQRLLGWSVGYRSPLGNVALCLRFGRWEPGRRLELGPWSFVDLGESDRDAVQPERVATTGDRSPVRSLETWVAQEHGSVSFEAEPSRSDEVLDAYTVFGSGNDRYLVGFLVDPDDPGHGVVLEADLGGGATDEDVYAVFELVYDTAALACRPGQDADPGSTSYSLACEPEL